MSDTTNNPGFTPGPWKVTPGNNTYGSVVSEVEHEGCHTDPRDVEAYGGYLIAESIREPNRSLIAASPDLYYEAEQNVKAMESLLAHLESCDEYCLGVDEQQNYPYRNEAIHSLKTRIGHTKAALAKARGGDA